MRDFRHCALLFASPQGLWGLSCRSGFRCWSNHSVAIEQLQSLVQPSPTPPRPAEALSVPGSIPRTSRDVSLLRLDVYSPPQVLQIDGRLCHLVLAFLVSETLQTAGLLRSTGVTPPHRCTANPSVTLSPSIDFPVEPVIRSTLLRRFRAGTRRGFSSCSACPCHRAVASTPPGSEGAASVRFRLPHAAFALRLRARPSGLRTFEATSCVHCRYGPGELVASPTGDVVDRLQSPWFPATAAIQTTGLLTLLAPAGPFSC